MNRSFVFPPTEVVGSTPIAHKEAVREAGFDILRTLAFFAVFCFHAPGVIRQPAVLRDIAEHGWIGVDLFFVLSGYLIGRQVFGRPAGHRRVSDIRAFWIRRWTRTLPLYFVVLLFYAVIKPRLLHMPFIDGHWGYAFFVQNYFPIVDFGQSWSLCVEEHFYLVFPLLALGLRGAQRWPAWVWLMPVAASLAFRIGFVVTHPETTRYIDLAYAVQFPTHAHLDGISIGIFLACVSRRWSGWSELPRMPLLALGLLTCGATLEAMPVMFQSSVGSMFFPTLLGISFGACLIGMQNLELPTPLAKLFFWLATYSFGAYLWHIPIARVCEHVLDPAAPWGVNAAVYLSASLFCAAVTYHAIEVPGLRLRAYLLPSARHGDAHQAQEAAGEGEGPGDLAENGPRH